MITIDQLLESVDLDFEPRFVTKDSDEEDGCICAWDTKPTKKLTYWQKTDSKKDKWAIIGYIKVAEFADKPWQECIYEVQRKTTGKIYKFDSSAIDTLYDSNPEKFKKFICGEIVCKLNEVIDAVNELKQDLKIARRALKDARILADTHCIASAVKTIDKALEQINHKEI
jgi:hypothetical protein